MSEAKVRAAIELAISAMTPALDTSFENAKYAPITGTPYQRVEWPDFMTENPTMGDGFYRIRSYFQITLCYPLQNGTADATARGMLIKALFKRGASFTNGGVTTIIEMTPIIGAGSIDGDRWSVPVKVRYRADIFP